MVGVLVGLLVAGASVGGFVSGSFGLRVGGLVNFRVGATVEFDGGISPSGLTHSPAMQTPQGTELHELPSSRNAGFGHVPSSEHGSEN